MTDEQTPAAGPSLLPCPFCGSESVSQDSTECTEAADYIWFKCEGCGVESEGEHGRDAALAQWNRRPHVPSPASSSSVVQGDASGVERDYTLRDHFLAMQAMATAYLMPEDYRDRDGRITLQGDNNNTEFWKTAQAGARAQAFANDMIYMLDGPEERAALAAEHDNDTAFLEATMAGFSLARNPRPQPSGETREALELKPNDIAAILEENADADAEGLHNASQLAEKIYRRMKDIRPAGEEKQTWSQERHDYEAMTVIAAHLRDNPAAPYSGRQCEEFVQFARDALFARPAGEGEREAVARIIDPVRWRRFDRHPHYADHVPRERQIEWSAALQDSLTKADAILSLLSPAAPDAGGGLRAIIDEATDAVLPPACETTGNGTQVRAKMQVEIADRILSALQKGGER